MISIGTLPNPAIAAGATTRMPLLSADKIRAGLGPNATAVSGICAGLIPDPPINNSISAATGPGAKLAAFTMVMLPGTGAPGDVCIAGGGINSRTRLLSRSATAAMPLALTATSQGKPSCAAAALPPSPENPADPVPAATVNTPFDPNSSTCCNPVSATYTLPLTSTATPRGMFQEPAPTLVTTPAGERTLTRAAPASV